MKLYRIVVLGVCLAVCGWAAYGQQTTGEITGTVTDTSGAVVPNATVTATNVATQQVRTTASNATGDYAIPYLTPGTYNVQTSMTGFKMDKATNLNLTVGAVLRMDFKLEVGAVSQQVEVTTAAPLISTESTAVQSTVEQQQIVALPLNGRDYLQLVALEPNVVSEIGTSGLVGLGGTRATSLISVAGQRIEYNHYTLDGVENTEPNYNTYIIHPSVDALQEFSVMTGIYSAEFGRGASQINATTLPGGNTYHGTAYDFLRNDAADARIWLQSQAAKNPFHREDYGFVLDGPLSIPHLFNGKDKLFFSSSFESLNDHESLQQLNSVPTDDMIAGDFNDADPGDTGTMPSGNQYTSLPGYNANARPIYWPASQSFNAPKGACLITSAGSYNASTQACTLSGTPNVLPSGLISPIALATINLLPRPNWNEADYIPAPADEETSISQNYITEAANLTQSTQFNQRVDWQMNARSSLFGRFSWEDDLSYPASALGELTADVTNSEAKQVVIGHTFVINSHIVNEARAGWGHFYNDTSSPYANGSFDPQGSLEITGLAAAGPQDYGYPSIGFGFTGIGGVAPYITYDNIYQYTDSVSIIKGKQSIKIGGSFEADEFNELGNQFGTGVISANGDATINPAYGATSGATEAGGFAMADWELGIVSGEYLRISALSNVEMRNKKYAVFFQDDYKMRPNLTLNLGIRYDNIRPWIDKHDNFWNDDVTSLGVAIQPAAPYTEPLVAITTGAANLTANGWVSSGLAPTNTPIYTRPGAAGCNFYGSASDPASLEFSEPGQPVQCGDQYMGRSTMAPNNENFGPRVGIDYALGAKTSIRAGFGIYYVTDQSEYAFDMGRNLGGKDGITSVPQGEYPPLSAPWSLETATAACGPNQYNAGAPEQPWAGLCSSASQFNITNYGNRTPYVEQYIFNVQRELSKNVAVEVAYSGNQSHHDLRYFMLNQTVPRIGPQDTTSETARTPWPALGNQQGVYDWDSGVYNALDAKISQHVSHGLLYQVAFTWGHSIDFGSSYRNFSGDILWPENSYWKQLERGNSQYNQPTRLVGSFNYNLPFGQGKDFAPGNPIVNHIVSGWVAGGILTFGHGTSINVASAGNPSQILTEGTAPEWQGIRPFKNPHPGIKGGISSGSTYWNPAAFACAYTATVTSYCSTPGYPNQSWQAGNWARNNLYGAGLEDVDANIGRTFHIWESHTLLVRVEAFNATNHVNWAVGTSTPSSATFGAITNTSQPMRELQGAIKYSF